MSNAIPKARECEWTNAQGEMNGLPAFLRVNATLQALAPIPMFTHLARFVLYFSNPGGDGMPQEEADFLGVDAIEDLVVDKMEAAGATLSLSLTHDGARELFFYTPNPQSAIEAWENQLQPAIKTHEVEFLLEEDEEWNAYRSFANS